MAWIYHVDQGRHLPTAAGICRRWGGVVGRTVGAMDGAIEPWMGLRRPAHPYRPPTRRKSELYWLLTLPLPLRVPSAARPALSGEQRGLALFQPKQRRLGFQAPPKPVSAPLLPITRWQGRMIGSGLRRWLHRPHGSRWVGPGAAPAAGSSRSGRTESTPAPATRSWNGVPRGASTRSKAAAFAVQELQHLLARFRQRIRCVVPVIAPACRMAVLGESTCDRPRSSPAMVNTPIGLSKRSNNRVMSVLQQTCRTGATGAAPRRRATAATVASALRLHVRSGAGPARGRAPAAVQDRRPGTHQAGRARCRAMYCAVHGPMPGSATQRATNSSMPARARSRAGRWRRPPRTVAARLPGRSIPGAPRPAPRAPGTGDRIPMACPAGARHRRRPGAARGGGCGHTDLLSEHGAYAHLRSHPSRRVRAARGVRRYRAQQGSSLSAACTCCRSASRSNTRRAAHDVGIRRGSTAPS